MIYVKATQAPRALDAKDFLFWLQNELQLFRNADALNLHQLIVEKYLREAEKCRRKIPAQAADF